jgi:hypothetical protein
MIIKSVSVHHIYRWLRSESIPLILGGSTLPVGVHVLALPIYSFCKIGQMLMYKLVS